MKKILFPIMVASAMSGCAQMTLDGVDYDGKATSEVEAYDSGNGVFMAITSVNGQKTSKIYTSISLPKGEYDVTFGCSKSGENNAKTFWNHQKLSVEPLNCYGFTQTDNGNRLLLGGSTVYVHTDPITGREEVYQDPTPVVSMVVQDISQVCKEAKIVQVPCDRE